MHGDKYLHYVFITLGRSNLKIKHTGECALLTGRHYRASSKGLCEASMHLVSAQMSGIHVSGVCTDPRANSLWFLVTGLAFFLDGHCSTITPVQFSLQRSWTKNFACFKISARAGFYFLREEPLLGFSKKKNYVIIGLWLFAWNKVCIKRETSSRSCYPWMCKDGVVQWCQVHIWCSKTVI